MSTSLIIFSVGLVAATATAVISYRGLEPIDPTPEKNWLVHLLGEGRVAGFMQRRLTRNSAGGLLLTVGFLSVLFLFLFAGVVFDMVDRGTGFAAFDMAVADYGAERPDSLMAEVSIWFTRLGGTFAVLFVAVGVGLYGWWRYGNPHVPLFMLTVTVGQAALVLGLKLFIDRARPDLNPLAPFWGSSFPSGHSAAAASIYAAAALVLTLKSARGARIAAAAGATFIAFGVGATRALLGVHWLTDVVAGLAIGYGWFIAAGVAFGGKIMAFGEPKDEVRQHSVGEAYE